MPAHGVHEVAGGLFEDAAKAAELLDERLVDLEAAASEAQALIASARRHDAARKLLAGSDWIQ